MSLALSLAVGGLVGAAVFLLLSKNLTRILMGLGVLSHAVNLLLLTAGGPWGGPAVAGQMDVTDPVPQALALTAIVISLAMTLLLLALAYRSYQVRQTDEVEDDIDSRRIASLRHESERLVDVLEDDALEVTP
jgi:multicomponent Na+:H+ antiporter subunit C